MWSTINIIRRKSPFPQMAHGGENEGAALLKLESGRCVPRTAAAEFSREMGSCERRLIAVEGMGNVRRE